MACAVHAPRLRDGVQREAVKRTSHRLFTSPRLRERLRQGSSRFTTSISNVPGFNFISLAVSCLPGLRMLGCAQVDRRRGREYACTYARRARRSRLC